MRSVTELVRNDLRFFGVWRTLCDVFIRSANRIVVFKILKVLKISSVDPQLLELGSQFQARFLTPLEMIELLDEPDFLVNQDFLEDVLEKGDACFGIFLEEKLVSFGWYSLQPTATSDDLTVRVPRDQVYMYKAYTREQYRGRRLMAIGTSLALQRHLAQGYAAFVCYVESNNFSSLKAFGRIGAQEIGRVWLIKLSSFTFILPSGRLKRNQVCFSKRTAAAIRHEPPESVSHTASQVSSVEDTRPR